MRRIINILAVGITILLISCNEYDVQQAAPESTFLTGITIGWYNPDATGNTHGKISIASETVEYDYVDPEMIIDSVFVSASAAADANFSLSDAWVTLSVGNGSVEPESGSPALGVPADFSQPVFYKVISVYGEERLYKIVFKIK